MNLYRKRYSNFLSVISRVLRNDYPIKVIYRNGNIAEFNEYQGLYNDLMQLEVDPTDNLVYINGLKFHGGKNNGDILNIFKKNEYSFLPVKEKEVVDIGANIGDSPIYFANRGAKSVIAVEPDMVSYDCAVENIDTNGYSTKIKLILAACGSIDGVASENQPESLTLTTLLQKYCSTPEILKIDCEGCEYDFILNASCNDLKKFTHIQIEYHLGYQNLKRKLEGCGFDVICTRPSFFVPLNKNRMTKLVHAGKSSALNRMFIGWLYATAKKSSIK